MDAVVRQTLVALDYLDLANPGVRHTIDQDETDAQQPPLRIRMAVIRNCSCADYGGPHFSIRTIETELHESFGVAISYTWGEFDRQQRRVGHVYDDSSKTVSLCLGAEWLVHGFMERLAELTELFGACWIDQICVPQNDEKIRKVLAAIPTLYKGLNVFVILPGPICGCLRRAHDVHEVAKVAHIASKQNNVVSLDGACAATLKELEAALQGIRCYNSNGSCSWMSRIWPLQEFRYAKSVSVRYSNLEVAPCCAAKDMITPSGELLLVPYLNLVAERLATQKEDLASSTTSIKRINADFWYAMQLMFLDIMGRETTDAGTTERIASLLLGRKWITVRSDGQGLLAKDEVLNTMSLISLGDRRILATDKRDYVLAIWSDWSEYQIPLDFKSLSVEALLANALRQFHRRTKVVVPTTFPRGLMGGISETWFWASADYGSEREFESAADLYGQFAWVSLVSSDGSFAIPVQVHPKDPGSVLSFGGLEPWMQTHVR